MNTWRYAIIDRYMNRLNEGVNYKIGKSSIHGNGVIATDSISKDSLIDTALVPDGISHKTTTFGAHLNHSNSPNAETRKENNIYRTYCIKDIEKGDEIVVDYTKNKELEQPEADWTP